MRFTLGLLVPLLAAVLLPTAAAARHARYYVSLGDSLAVGFQPSKSGRGHTTRQGYVDQLFRIERRRVRGLRLVKLGWAGEGTLSTRPNSSACSYGTHRNQLEAAEAFLRRHRRQVAFVTIDI